MENRKCNPQTCSMCGGGLKEIKKDFGECPFCGTEWQATERYRGPKIPDSLLQPGGYLGHSGFQSTAVLNSTYMATRLEECILSGQPGYRIVSDG